MCRWRSHISSFWWVEESSQSTKVGPQHIQTHPPAHVHIPACSRTKEYLFFMSVLDLSKPQTLLSELQKEIQRRKAGVWPFNLLVHSYLYLATSVAARYSNFDLNTALKSFLSVHPICIPFNMPLPTSAPVGLAQQINVEFALRCYLGEQSGQTLSGTRDRVYWQGNGQWTGLPGLTEALCKS